MNNDIVAVDHTNFKNLDLHCAICKNFLSSPIRICEKGQICGKCDPGCVAFPHPTMEKILSEMIFSCKNKEKGCIEELPFDCIIEHESKCVYIDCICLYENCQWSGHLVQLQGHLHSVHKVAFERNTKLELLDSEDTTGFCLKLVQDVPFIISYKRIDETLSIKVTYISAYVDEATYTVFSEGNTVKLCEGYAHAPDRSVYDTEFQIKFPKSLDIKLTYIYYDAYFIDYNLLKDLVCMKCENYLVPHAYEYQPFGAICGTCGKNEGCILSKDQSIIDNIKKANFPCRWKKCNFVLKAHKILPHEENCQHYIYHCPLCLNFIGLQAQMLEHLRNHAYKTLDNKQLLICRIGDTVAPTKVFLIHRNTFFVITCYLDADRLINVKLETAGPRKDDCVYMQFLHSHCRIKSRLFCIVNKCLIETRHLPGCFTLKPYLFLDAFITTSK